MLDDIPGIGERRRKALMRKFRSVEKIRDASLEELADTESMNAASAQQVYEFFHQPPENSGVEEASEGNELQVNK